VDGQPAVALAENSRAEFDTMIVTRGAVRHEVGIVRDRLATLLGGRSRGGGRWRADRARAVRQRWPEAFVSSGCDSRGMGEDRAAGPTTSARRRYRGWRRRTDRRAGPVRALDRPGDRVFCDGALGYTLHATIDATTCAGRDGDPEGEWRKLLFNAPAGQPRTPCTFRRAGNATSGTRAVPGLPAVHPAAASLPARQGGRSRGASETRRRTTREDRSAT